jgi:hypothetical protein
MKLMSMTGKNMLDLLAETVNHRRTNRGKDCIYRFCDD